MLMGILWFLIVANTSKHNVLLDLQRHVAELNYGMYRQLLKETGRP